MLTFILGMAGYGKTTRLWQQLKEDARAKKSKRYIVLVPEQFLFVAEKQLASFLENKLDLNIEVTGFNKLCKEIALEDDISEEARKFLLFSAVTRVQGILLALEQAKKPRILQETHSLLEQLENIKDLGKLLDSIRTVNRKLSYKLLDIRVIAETYRFLMTEKFGKFFSSCEIATTCDLLKRDGNFDETNFYIDSFFTFSDGKLRILESIFSVANDLFVTLPLPGSLEDGFDSLKGVRETRSKLEAMAKKLEIQVREPIILQSLQRFKNQELKSLEKEFFKLMPRISGSETSKIVAVRVPNCHEEVRFVSAMINKLVKEEGYRFKDFVVLVKNLNSYSLLIKSEFKKFGISFFLDDKKSAKNSVLGHMISDFLKLLCGNFSFSDVIEFAKQPFLKADRQVLGILENCVTTQKIKDKNWLENFESLEDLEAVSKEDLRALKNNVILPILKVKAKIGGSANDFAKALFEYFDENQVFNAPNCVDTNDELVHAKFINILDDFVKVFGNESVSEEEIEALRDALMNANVAAESQKLDQVIVTSAEKARLWNPKVVFLLGNIGEPADARASVIFSAKEIEMLADFGCDFGYFIAEDEEFTVYRSLTAASDRIFVLCAEENLSTKQDESIVIEKLKRIFPNLKYGGASDFLDELDLAQNEQTATELLCEWHCPAEGKQLCGETEKDNILASPLWQRDFCIENMKNPTEVSASLVEDFYSCRFRYFCEHILKLKKVPVGAELKNREISLILHGVMSDLLMSYFGNGNLGPKIKLNKEAKQILLEDLKNNNKIKKLIESLTIKHYARLVTGQKDSREKNHALHKIVEMALNVASKVIFEVIQSKFIPYAFELELPESCDLFSKGTIKLSGKVDRVDFWESDGNLWIRVIDYKWGKNKFKLEDLCSGVRIQALFYLLVLTKHWGAKNGLNVLPAGALYMSIKDKPMNVTARDTVVDKAAFGMNGLFADNIDVLRAMEEKLEGKIIPVGIKNDGSLKSSSYLFSEAGLESLKEEVEGLIDGYLEGLQKGEFSPKPLKHKDFDLCAVCEFRRFCRLDERECERALK
ncbi:ATP-dependent helicase/deoxyribonuclease subunit B [Clostridia bacterium]|nr:ATP-dependent helicase/deoxyribonuclease subunit B [Clostridia bacterium]